MMLEFFSEWPVLKDVFVNVVETVSTRFLNLNDSEIAYHYLVVNIIAFAFLLRVGLSIDYLRKQHVATNSSASISAVLRSIFSKDVFCSRSFYADIGIFITNLVLFGLLSVLISNFISNPEPLFLDKFNGIWATIFGAHTPIAVSPFVENIIFTTLLFISYETQYYLAHRAFHQIPILWQFHKVHHSATRLNFMTDNRFHAFEWFGFFVYVGLSAAFSKSVCVFLFGGLPQVVAINGIMIHYAILYSLTLAQHSNLWLSFGRFDYVVVSPAMHIIHHSTNPKNFNTNYALNLAFLDYMFGTFKKSNKLPPENLEVGLGANKNENTVWSNASLAAYFYWPFLSALKIVRRKISNRYAIILKRKIRT